MESDKASVDGKRRHNVDASSAVPSGKGPGILSVLMSWARRASSLVGNCSAVARAASLGVDPSRLMLEM